MDENVKALLVRLEGRKEMNLRTAEKHPDASVRETAKIRAQSYAIAILDVELTFGVKL